LTALGGWEWLCEIEESGAGVVSERGGFGGIIEHKSEPAVDSGGQASEIGAEGDFPASGGWEQIEDFADEVECGSAGSEDHVDGLRLMKELFGDPAGPAMVAADLQPRGQLDLWRERRAGEGSGGERADGSVPGGEHHVWCLQHSRGTGGPGVGLFEGEVMGQFVGAAGVVMAGIGDA
jgi:hypothetical protein